MKKCLLCALALILSLMCVLPASLADEVTVPDVTLDAKPVPETEAMAFVRSLGVGFNLGNAFDASECTWLLDEMEYERAWCGAYTTEALLDALKEAGFSTLRLPVSWHNHVSGEGYVISEAWLSRVQQVIDWALERDLRVILNIHHDNNTSFFYPSAQYEDQSMRYITAIWTQLAQRFADYDERLIFESMNEPRLVGSRCEWSINNCADCKKAMAIINDLNQAFVDLVRASGSVNATRYLIVPGYDASPEGALNPSFVLPTDPNEANDHRILLGVHAYTPYNFALNEHGTAQWAVSSSKNRSEVTGFMDRLYYAFVSKGQPVVLTEFGARDKGGNTDARTQFTAFYVAAARARGISCIWWDNNALTGSGELFCIIDRASSTWKYPSIRDALVRYGK